MKLLALLVSWLVLSFAVSFGQNETKGQTYTSLDPAGKADENFAPGLLQFTDSDLTQVLDVYRELSGRTVVRSASLPNAKISLKSATSLTRIEALQALDTVLAQNSIVMIPQGTKFVKAVAAQAAAYENPPCGGPAPRATARFRHVHHLHRGSEASKAARSHRGASTFRPYAEQHSRH